MHRVHPEKRRNAQTVEVVAGLLKPREDEVALPIVRRAGDRPSSAASHRPRRGKWTALQVTLLRTRKKWRPFVGVKGRDGTTDGDN